MSQRLPSPGRLTSRILSSRSHVERQLRTYGENTVAAKLGSIPDEDFDRIGQRAFHHASSPTGRRKKGGMLLDKALALAAVEIIEGAPRALRRKRRVYA